jgi:multiple sugar transport system ATP-binding protein
MIAGLEDISDGTLSIGGRVVNELEPKERDISMVFQSYALYPHRTVFENIAFPLELAKVPMSQIKTRVMEVARILELTEQLDKKPGQLSGGQRQRVAMGRAIIREPSVYLLDEPLSNLDAKLRDQTRSEMVDLQARLGVTTVYVTHDQVEALTMGHRVAVMNDGLLQQVAPPRELYQRPANQFVAGFIGTPAMNFVPAISTEGRVTVAGHVVPIEGALSIPDGPLTVGARPEQLELAATGINGTVVGVEDLGVESIVRVNADILELDKPFVLRLQGQTDLVRDQAVTLGFKSDVHLFDLSGERIGATP